MARDKIKGITIQLGLDGTGISKSLKEINSDLGRTQASLKQVEKNLKLDPKNTEMLAQKQKLLAHQTDLLNKKLKTLQEINQKAADSAKNYEPWLKAYAPIQQEISKTKDKIFELKQAQQRMEDLGEVDTEGYKRVQEELKATEKQARLLQAEARKVSEEFGNPISPEGLDAIQRELAEVEGQTKKATAEIKNLKNAGNEAAKQIGNSMKSAGEKISSIGSKMTGISVGIVGAGATAFKFASDTAESMNKVEVAFKNSAGSVKKFAETTLETYGIAEGTALDMASLFGDMATSMGISEKKAAEMSIRLTGLAGDLASFKNVGIDQAMTALNGVFTGETESLKMLGVVMTETNLKAYALANGFKKEYDEMSQAEKVQLRYKYVLNQTKNAHGDFVRTQDGAANSTRVLLESLKELAASFGEVLIPVITPLIQKLTELIQWFGSLDENTKKTIITILGIIAVAGPLLSAIGNISSGIGSVINLVATLKSGFGGLSASSIPSVTKGLSGIGSTIAGKVTPVFTGLATKVLPMLGKAVTFLFSPQGLILAAVTAAVVGIGIKGDELQAKLQQFNDWLQGIFAKDWTEVFGPVLGGVVNNFLEIVKGVWDGLKQTFDGIIDFIRGIFTRDWERAWKGVKEIFGGIFNTLVSIAKAPVNGIITLLNGVINSLNKMIDGLNSIKFDVPDWVPFIGGKHFALNIGHIGNIPLLAKGGILSKGSAIVGEAGPELLTMQNGRAVVQPLNSQSSTTNNNLGGVNINVYGAPGQDVRELAEIVMDKIETTYQGKVAVFGN